MDVFAQERGKLATYRVEGNRILKTVNGTNWREIFTYGDFERLRELAVLLNDAAIGNSTWLRRELQGEPTEVLACDDCPLFDHLPSRGQPKSGGSRVGCAVRNQGSRRRSRLNPAGGPVAPHDRLELPSG